MSEKRNKKYDGGKPGEPGRVAESVEPYDNSRGERPSMGDVLEAADKLSLDEQEDVVQILKKRISEKRRAELIEDLRISEEEYRRGECKQVTPDELRDELLS